jgi:hypothetical protein
MDKSQSNEFYYALPQGLLNMDLEVEKELGERATSRRESERADRLHQMRASLLAHQQSAAVQWSP